MKTFLKNASFHGPFPILWTCSLADQGLVWHFQMAHWANKFGHLDKYICEIGQMHSANWKNTFWTCSLADQGLVWHFQLAHWASGMQGLEQRDTEAMHSKRIWNKTKMSQVGSKKFSHWTEKKMSGGEDSALICIQSESANGKREENRRRKNQQWCIGEHNASTSKASLSLDFLKRMR